MPPPPLADDRAAAPLLRCARVVALVAVASLIAVSAFRPDLLAPRFRGDAGIAPPTFAAAASTVAASLWGAAAALALLGLLMGAGPRAQGRLGALLAGGLLWCAFLAFARPLQGWLVDDAAITFAYAENLAHGHGLVAHPALPPEEGYSPTSWMLLLAAASAAGLELAGTAVVASQILAGLTLLLVTRAALKLLGRHASPEAMVLTGTVALGAPLAVWLNAGLEHALQAFLITATATAPLLWRRWHIVGGLSLALLTLTRPEAPLLVGALTVALVLARRREATVTWRRIGWTVAPACAAAAALLAFRLLYFGDPLPNPYYAKAQGTTTLRLFNPFGSGWRYLLDWASASGTLVLVPLLLLGATARQLPLAMRAVAALGLGQLAFVILVGGDWMDESRFVAPVLPLAAIATAYAHAELQMRVGVARAGLVALVASAALALCTTVSLVRFVAAPTTPLATVSAIGHEFATLAQRLGVERPTVATHDAGGTTWAARLELVDLGGLCNRALAQHMDDRAFVERYLFEQRRPTFVFGSTTQFAAGRTGFHLSPRFAADYVALEFPGRPYMDGGLCHVRREVVREVPGLRTVRDGGRVVKVVVEG
ncbi:MAG: hypothetical protein AAF628_06075 [Planctomycetota bacterium]